MLAILSREDEIMIIKDMDKYVHHSNTMKTHSKILCTMCCDYHKLIYGLNIAECVPLRCGQLKK